MGVVDPYARNRFREQQINAVKNEIKKAYAERIRAAAARLNAHSMFGHGLAVSPIMGIPEVVNV